MADTQMDVETQDTETQLATSTQASRQAAGNSASPPNVSSACLHVLCALMVKDVLLLMASHWLASRLACLCDGHLYVTQ